MHREHTDSDSDHNGYSDASTLTTEALRAGLFRSSIARILVSLVLVGTFWISYTWLIASILLTFTFGAIGAVHFASQEALYHNHCCCAPRPSVLFLYYATVVNVPLAVVGLISSMFTVINDQSDGDLSVVSVIVLVDCALLLFNEVYFFVRCRVMRSRMNDDGAQYDQNPNQVGPEVVQVWAYRHPHDGSAVEMAVVDVGGNILPHSTGVPVRTPGVMLSRHPTVSSSSQSRPVVFGYPITQEIQISVQPSPFRDRGEGPWAANNSSGVVLVAPADSALPYGPHSTPDFVSTTGMLGYGAPPAPPPPGNDDSSGLPRTGEELL